MGGPVPTVLEGTGHGDGQFPQQWKKRIVDSAGDHFRVVVGETDFGPAGEEVWKKESDASGWSTVGRMHKRVLPGGKTVEEYTRKKIDIVSGKHGKKHERVTTQTVEVTVAP